MTSNLSRRLARLEQSTDDDNCPDCDPRIRTFELYEGDPEPPPRPPCQRCGSTGPEPISEVLICLGPRLRPAGAAGDLELIHSEQ